MKKMLANFANSLLSKEQMKKVKGGYSIVCRDECGYFGSSSPVITSQGGCGSSSLSACQGYGVNGAMSYGMDWCGHTCWPV